MQCPFPHYARYAAAPAAPPTMWVLFASANRDRHDFGPGRGVHYCLDAPLARPEATIALQALAQRFARVEVLDPDGLRYAPSCVLRGLEQLDVRLTPR